MPEITDDALPQADGGYLARLFADPSDALRSCQDNATALDFLDYVRWSGSVTCPHCGSADVVAMPQRQYQAKRRRMCNGCRKHFSTTSGTPFSGQRLRAQALVFAVAHSIDTTPDELAAQISRAMRVTPDAALNLARRVVQWRAQFNEPSSVEMPAPTLAAEDPPAVEDLVVEDPVETGPPSLSVDVSRGPSSEVAQVTPDTPVVAVERPVSRRRELSLPMALVASALILSTAALLGLRQAHVLGQGSQFGAARLQVPVSGNDRVLVAYWAHRGQPQSYTTIREDREPREAWSQRHRANVRALMQEFPPDD